MYRRLPLKRRDDTAAQHPELDTVGGRVEPVSARRLPGVEHAPGRVPPIRQCPPVPTAPPWSRPAVVYQAPLAPGTPVARNLDRVKTALDMPPLSHHSAVPPGAALIIATIAGHARSATLVTHCVRSRLCALPRQDVSSGTGYRPARYSPSSPASPELLARCPRGRPFLSSRTLAVTAATPRTSNANRLRMAALRVVTLRRTHRTALCARRSSWCGANDNGPQANARAGYSRDPLSWPRAVLRVRQASSAPVPSLAAAHIA